MRRLRGVLLILITVSLSLGSVHAQTETAAPAPYLYYFSNFLNAWVIERADGSDSRILGEGVMPQGTNVAYGNWSPSGEWFAWQNGASSEGAISFSAAIINADGSKRITTLNSLQRVNQLTWSPVADLLFALVASNSREEQPHFYLIDVPNDKIIASGSFPAFPILEGIQGVWSPDGSSIRFEYSEYHADDESNLNQPWHWVTINAADGHITDEVAIGYDYYSLENGHYDWELTQNRDRYRLIFRVPATDTIETTNAYFSNIDMLEWSPDGTRALVAQDQPCQGVGYCFNLWLLALNTTGDFYTLTGIAGDFYPYLGASENAVITHWSPDGKYAWFISAEAELYLFNAETGTAEVLALEDEPSVAYWSPDSQYLVARDTSSVWLTMINVETRSSQRFGGLTPLNSGYIQPIPITISPNNRQIALGNQLGIVQVENGWIAPLVQHSAATYGGFEIYSYWSPDSQWLITEQSIFFAGGRGGEPRGAMVTQADGNARRELTKALGTIGWLPDRVVPHLSAPRSTPAIQQPATSLLHNADIVGVAWSPDGQQLVSVTNGELWFWSIGEQENRVVGNWPVVEGCSNGRSACTLLWSPDGRQLAYNLIMDIPAYLVMDVETKQAEDIVLGNSFHWLPDGSYEALQASEIPASTYTTTIIAPNDEASAVEIKETASDKLIRTLPIARAYAAYQFKDSQYFFILSSPKVFIWNLSTDALVELQNANWNDSYLLSPDGKTFASWSIYSDEIHLIDATTGEQVGRINWSANALDFSPDGRWLAAGNTRLVTIWDVNEALERKQ